MLIEQSKNDAERTGDESSTPFSGLGSSSQSGTGAGFPSSSSSSSSPSQYKAFFEALEVLVRELVNLREITVKANTEEAVTETILKK